MTPMVARCSGCSKIRWLSENEVKQSRGLCPRCGGRIIKPTNGMRWHERITILYWYIWDHMQDDPSWVWWKHPVELARGIWHGLHVEEEVVSNEGN